VEELRDALEAALVAGVKSDAAAVPQGSPPAPTGGGADGSRVRPIDVDEELVRAESKSADFVRFEAEEVAAEMVQEVNTFCAASGEQFIDPAFPPINRSMYKSEQWATMWECVDCRTMNILPEPLSKQMMMMSIPRAPMVCKGCNKPATRINAESRPTQWLRPRDIRDDVTLQIGGTPWVIFREEPRSDDVRQGALGNCWFVGALSVAAERPELIRRMFLAGSHEINPNAAYQLRLCRDGVWHTVLVDDVFPCTNLEMLAYSKAARRQLWVPLVEKAAAKLFGCYQNLSSGTLSEALTLFTGFPTEQVMLGGHGQIAALPEGADPEAVAAHAEQIARVRGMSLKPEALWEKLMACKEKGFIMGTACVALEARNRGLSAPHAYGILDMREISKDLRLLKLRNPWGQDKWDGHWGTHSNKWVDREDLKRMLRPEREDAGVFWISLEDWVEYFASVEICRVRQDWAEVRTSGWLPSGVGLGTAVEFSCFTETEVDIVMHQEGHVMRVDTVAHQVDLGFAVIRHSEDGTIELIDDTTRQMDSMVSKSIRLGEGSYSIIPLCFNQLLSTAPRKYSLVTHSSQPLLIEKKDCEPPWMAEAMIQRVIKHGKRSPMTPDGLVSCYMYTGINEPKGEAGITVVIENYSHTGFSFNLDFGDKNGTVSSRRSHCCQDVIPAQKRALLAVLSPEEGRGNYGWQFGHEVNSSGSNEELHFPELDPSDRIDSIHRSQDCPPLQPDHPSQTTPALPSGAADGQGALADILRNIGAMGGGGGGGGGGAPTPGSGPAPEQKTAAEMEEEMMQAAIRASLGDSGDGA